MPTDIEREIFIQQIPRSWQASYRKALAGNRPAAVKVMCGQCQGWEDGARQAIRDCPSVGCPLHAVRPFRNKASEHDDLDEQELDSQVTIAANDLASVKSKIVEHLRRYGESARGYIIFTTGIAESLWNDAIRSLLAENIIDRTGEKRSTRYRLKESEISK